VVVAAVVVVASGGYGLVVPAPPYAGWVALFAVAAHLPGLRRAMVAGGAVAAALIAGSVGAAALHPDGLASPMTRRWSGTASGCSSGWSRT